MSANISIFVPHFGCPNMCSFCNQRHIAGSFEAPDKQSIEAAVKTAVSSKNFDSKTTEIAFFGGSFTAIDRDYMVSLLSFAYPFVQNGTVKGIRVSTRPDAIDIDVLTLLKQYGVTAIELGAQSMQDDVLVKNNRGHTVEDVMNASNLIKKMGFELGLQMMTGLYGSNNQLDIETAKKIIELTPDTVRIYPTIVLENTDLGELYKKGKYLPQTLDDAVSLTVELLNIFRKSNIKVIRTGLHTIDEDKYLAGPWHPAFSELCFSKIYFEKMIKELKISGEYTVFVNPKEISKAIGQKRENIQKIKDLGFHITIKGDDNLKPLEIIIKRDVKNQCC